jgi:hypothetical protein
VKAPLTEWRAADLQGGIALDSEQACKDVRSKMTSNAKDLLHDAPRDLENMPLQTSEQAGGWVFALEALASRCVPSDDPNIKAK